MIELIAAIVGIIIGVGTIFAAVNKFAVKRLKAFITECTAELRNNGGSSVKDAVERIELKVDALHGRVNVLSDTVEDNRQRIGHLEHPAVVVTTNLTTEKIS